MSKLSKIAKNIVNVGNYTPLATIIEEYKDGVDVTGITVKATKDKPNAVAFIYTPAFTNTIVDNETGEVITNTDAAEYFFFAESGDLAKIAAAWQAEMTLDEINDELHENPVKIKIEKVPTRNKREYIKATIIE